MTNANKTAKKSIAVKRDFTQGGVRSRAKHTGSPDPLTEYGHELARLHAKGDELDDKRYSKDDTWRESFHQSEYRHVFDRIAALESLIATTKATSPEGGLIQLALLAQEMHDLEAFENDEAGLHRALRKCSRLLYSLRDVLQDASALLPEEIAVSRYMSDAQNPWLGSEDRIELADTRRPKAAA